MSPLTPECLIHDLTLTSDPRVSPDGRSLVHIQTRVERADGRVVADLWRRDIDGGHATRLTWGGGRCAAPRWSPDGGQVAFVSDRVPKSGLFVLPLTGGEAREVTRHGQEIRQPAWSPDGTRLAYVTQVDPENPTETAPPADAAPRVRATRRLDYKQDGRGYLNDARLQVFTVEVASGERRQVSAAPFDHQGPTWSPDGRWLAAQRANRNGMCSQLALFDLATGDERLVGAEMGVVELWSWSPSGDRLLLAGETSLAWQSDFFLYDLASGATRRLTTDLACWPAADYPGPLPSPPVWLDDDLVLFHGLHAGNSGLYRLDTRDGAVETLQTWPARHVGLSVDAARRVAAQGYSGATTVGEIAVTDLATGVTTPITALNAALLEAAPPASGERFSIERGGLTIDAWLLKPPDFDPARRYPLLLDVHGGPHNLYGDQFSLMQQCLATHGFLVVYANPRGSGSYGRAFASSVVGDWGGEDYLDLLAVVDAVLARPYADAARTGIYGFSYGGFMTAWAIGQTDRFKAAVCGAPVFDLVSFYGTSDVGHIFGRQEFGGAPHEAPAWFAAHSPATFAHRATTPTLIIHGEADERCPIGQGEQMFVALVEAGCEVEFARYPGGSHGFVGGGPAAHRIDVMRRVLAWFSARLGSPGA